MEEDVDKEKGRKKRNRKEDEGKKKITTYSSLGEQIINYQIFIKKNFTYDHKPSALKYVK